MNRRHHDNPESPHRRREDELEELLEHGSRNFRRYRRRAYLAFAILAVANALALYLAIDNGRDADRDLKASIQQLTERNCESGNDLRAGLRAVIEVAIPDRPRFSVVRQVAADSFAPRDCTVVSRLR